MTSERVMRGMRADGELWREKAGLPKTERALRSLPAPPGSSASTTSSPSGHGNIFLAFIDGDGGDDSDKIEKQSFYSPMVRSVCACACTCVRTYVPAGKSVRGVVP